jgi:hypothetical protein
MMRSGSNEHIPSSSPYQHRSSNGNMGSPSQPSRSLGMHTLTFPSGPVALTQSISDRGSGSGSGSGSGGSERGSGGSNGSSGSNEMIISFDGLDRSLKMSPSLLSRTIGVNIARGHTRAHSDQGLSPRLSRASIAAQASGIATPNAPSPFAASPSVAFSTPLVSVFPGVGGSGMPAPLISLSSSTGRSGSGRSSSLRSSRGGSMIRVRRMGRDASPLLASSSSSTGSSAQSSPLRTPQPTTRDPSPFASPANSPRVSISYTLSPSTTPGGINGILSSPSTFYPSQPVAAAVANGAVVTMSTPSGDSIYYRHQNYQQTRAALSAAASNANSAHKPQPSRPRPPPMLAVALHAAAAASSSSLAIGSSGVGGNGSRGSGSRPPVPLTQWAPNGAQPYHTGDDATTSAAVGAPPSRPVFATPKTFSFMSPST